MRDFLPPMQSLTAEQNEALRCPLKKTMVATGPPGSGKTVIALYRTNILQKSKKKIDLVVYGRVLQKYLQTAIQEIEVDGAKIEAQTFYSWFPKFYKKITGERPPEIERWFYDWDIILKKFAAMDVPKVFDHLIIDEGQDLPNDFFKWTPYISNTVTVFADENQAIFQATNASIKNIINALESFEPKIIELTKNHRNTAETAKFANMFATKGIKTGMTELPTRKGSKPMLRQLSKWEEQVEPIKIWLDNNPNHQIGIFCEHTKAVDKWVKKIKEIFDKASGITIQSYNSKRRREPLPDFSSDRTITVLTTWSAKGLEFDTVFVPDLESYEDSVETVMRCYVSFSRPVERLILSYVGTKYPSILAKKISREDIEDFVETAGQPDNAATLRELLTELRQRTDGKINSGDFNYIQVNLAVVVSPTDRMTRKELIALMEKMLPDLFGKKVIPEVKKVWPY